MAKDGIILGILQGRIYPGLSFWALNAILFPYIREAAGILKHTAGKKII